MFDGIKIQDVTVYADCNGVPSLLTNDRLTFGGLVDGQTGAVLDPTQRAIDRGLTFRLVPRRTGGGRRVEVKGSLHKFYNDGQHNADQFTADDLLLTLDQLVTDYWIDPFTSKINNIEFGVNVVLPFAVSHVLQNLVSYKNKPFARDTHSKTLYYEHQTQRFTMKLYDKGKQRGLADNVLRVEIRVRKMVYFDRTGVHLNTLADLLNVANYAPLGALLSDMFSKIIVDDPTINPDELTPREREIYQNGRNPRYWQTPDDLTPTQANTYRQRLHRIEQHYRALLATYRRGEDWQDQTAVLIAETWQRLTAVSDDLLTRIDDRRTAWKALVNAGIVLTENQAVYCESTVRNPPATCHELTGSTIPIAGNFAGNQRGGNCHELTDPVPPDLSRINPLCSGLQSDAIPPPPTTATDAAVCPVTGVSIPDTNGAGVRRYVSAVMLRNDDDLLLQLNAQFGQYAKGSKEDEFSRAAHNVRNAHTNPRNNLQRSINKIYRQPTLFDVSDTLRLTADQRAALDRR